MGKLLEKKLTKKKKYLVCIFSVSAVVLLMISWNNSQEFSGVYQYYHLPRVSNRKTKYILYWDTFFGAENFELGFGSAIFDGCIFSNCYATHNRSLIPVDEFDAVVFHGARFNTSTSGIPSVRSTAQKYIFLSKESPFNCQFDKSVDKNFYNWSMTYRRDSEIFYPYGVVKRTKTAYALDKNQIRGKTKMVAWFASNCFTHGAVQRLQYVKELSEHIPVDVYGKCGSLRCTDRLQCYRMLQKDYLFYLSFENSMCDDYVTEKLYNVLQYNVVPVVLGASDYSLLAPPNSVINIKDFGSVKELASYLMRLSTNLTEYSKYLTWKTSYVVGNPNKQSLCQLCQLLNRPVSHSSYESIEDWFFKGCDSQAGIFNTLYNVWKKNISPHFKSFLKIH